MSQPIEITLHDSNTKEPKIFIRSFIPWGILKRAMRLIKQANLDDPSEDDLDEMAAFVVALFGDQFTVDQVNNEMDIEDMARVLEMVVSRAVRSVAGKKGNPTPAA